MVCHAFYPLLATNGVVINVASYMGGLSQVSQDLQTQFVNATSEDTVSELMDQFVERAQKGDHKEAGFSNTAYGMSKLAMIAVGRVHAKQLSHRKVGKFYIYIYLGLKKFHFESTIGDVFFHKPPFLAISQKLPYNFDQT